MDMVERVARALADGDHLGVSLAFEDVFDTDKGSIPLLKKRDTERAMAAAHAAIKAMREPTEAMSKAGVYQLPDYLEYDSSDMEYASAVWEAMVDAATP